MEDKALDATNALRQMLGLEAIKPDIRPVMHPIPAMPRPHHVEAQGGAATGKHALPVLPFVGTPVRPGFAPEEEGDMVEHPAHRPMWIHRPHHRLHGSFLRRVHHALMSLGPWEGRAVAFVGPRELGLRGAALPDVEALVDYIYSTLSLDLDYILPFAAVPENRREIDDLDDKSELAHRIMLVNLLRLLGVVKNKKVSRHFVTRPTQVILPLSPNHGLFGNDGLYSESKISLETLFNRWNSESWGEYLCLAGAVIGWTRGTGLMEATNTVAHELEGHGVRTFSAKEMAFEHPLLFSITQVEPIWADLNGGMDRLPDLADITTRIRTDLAKKSELRRSIARDSAADFKIINGVQAERVLQTVNVTPRANFQFSFPPLEPAESLKNLSQLRGMIDLEKVVVVTGFAEVGPWGLH
ncbi:hypothetical protein K466DRAFT_606870 [Polyporus arcularius HHB13444]|uniref:Uncharacterized protein n=1 Tax=Polyporus arcularius HHB13444 TaxID=1314778 RepID=A0A5C3NRI5_9APHY|nr:hypothetical protein K466DRAFT_606870 [Polyporus arcularius HHB13444]